MEALAKLKPAFAAGGVVTAGNSSQTSDGAAFVIVMGEKMINELGLKPIGRLVSSAVAGVNPRLIKYKRGRNCAWPPAWLYRLQTHYSKPHRHEAPE
jgi:hypothetical protein